jgi:hypothetical protein
MSLCFSGSRKKPSDRISNLPSRRDSKGYRYSSGREKALLDERAHERRDSATLQSRAGRIVGRQTGFESKDQAIRLLGEIQIIVKVPERALLARLVPAPRVSASRTDPSRGELEMAPPGLQTLNPADSSA